MKARVTKQPGTVAHRFYFAVELNPGHHTATGHTEIWRPPAATYGDEETQRLVAEKIALAINEYWRGR